MKEKLLMILVSPLAYLIKRSNQKERDLVEQARKILEDRGHFIASASRMRQWADGKLEFCIALGLWETLGAGYRITIVERTGIDVRYPLTLRVEADFRTVWSGDGNDTWSRHTLIIEAEKCTVGAIVRATRAAVPTAIETTFSVKRGELKVAEVKS